jgi:hypothetical protein
MPNDQASSRDSLPLSMGAKIRIKVAHSRLNEFHTAIGHDPAGKQWLQNIAVKDKDAPDFPAGHERLVKCSVVFRSQITAEPHQTFVVSVHVMRLLKV